MSRITSYVCVWIIASSPQMYLHLPLHILPSTGLARSAAQQASVPPVITLGVLLPTPRRMRFACLIAMSRHQETCGCSCSGASVLTFSPRDA